MDGMATGFLIVTWVGADQALGLQALLIVQGGKLTFLYLKLFYNCIHRCTINSDQEFWVSHYQNNDVANNYLEQNGQGVSFQYF